MKKKLGENVFISRFNNAYRWRWVRCKAWAREAWAPIVALQAGIWKWLAIRLCRAGLNGLYWHLKPAKDSWETRMGYRKLKQYYDSGREDHKALMAESSPERRVELYKKMYDNSFGFLEKHFGLATFSLGFDEGQLAPHLELFRGRDVLDYGCGLGHSSACLSRSARHVIGLDASSACIDSARKAYGHLSNVEFVLHQSSVLPFADESLDAVYSSDFFEHLHPDDGVKHLMEIHRILKKGGQYLLLTPPAEMGPFDGTKWFFPAGCGFTPICGHLKEYTGDELAALVRQVGFSKIDYPRPGHRTVVLMTK